MKKGIHPESKEILVVDRSADFVLKVFSTAKTADTYEFEGKEYPCIFVETSSASHPFYTGEQKILKTWAVDKFYARMKKAEELNKKKYKNWEISQFFLLCYQKSLLSKLQV